MGFDLGLSSSTSGVDLDLDPDWVSSGRVGLDWVGSRRREVRFSWCRFMLPLKFEMGLEGGGWRVAGLAEGRGDVAVRDPPLSSIFHFFSFSFSPFGISLGWRGGVRDFFFFLALTHSLERVLEDMDAREVVDGRAGGIGIRTLRFFLRWEMTVWT